MVHRVRVYGIFTKDARSSCGSEQRRARLANDLAIANRVWGSSAGGSPSGANCRLTFLLGSAFDETNTRISGESVGDAFDSRISLPVDGLRSANGNAPAIYVVYVSGDYLSNGTAIGSGGPRFRYYRSPSDYGFYGQVVLTDIAGSSRSPYTFAHEAGHCLFGYIDSSNRYRGTDPASNSSYHHSDPRNLMYAYAGTERPRLTSTQCQRAARSTIVLENAGRSGSNGRPILSACNSLGMPARPRIRVARGATSRKPAQ